MSCPVELGALEGIQSLGLYSLDDAGGAGGGGTQCPRKGIPHSEQ